VPEGLQSYGGKRDFLATMWHAGRARLGAYRSYEEVNWPLVRRFVFVCKGNLCRSPYAEHRIRAWGAKAVSAGLSADPDKPAAPAAQQAALRRGVDLEGHISRPVYELIMSYGDLLVAFEPTHAKVLSALARTQAGVQVTLLPLWSPTPWLVYLHDPYGLPGMHFDRCFEQIDRGLKGMLERVPGTESKTHGQ
jgi:protein-tyrosine phosphatase